MTLIIPFLGDVPYKDLYRRFESWLTDFPSFVQIDLEVLGQRQFKAMVIIKQGCDLH